MSLHLTRKKGESIFLELNGDKRAIEIKLLQSGDYGALIGISAPDHITILRSEVLERNEIEDNL